MTILLTLLLLAPGQDLRRNGSVFAKIEANGDIRIRGRVVGKFESNGNIRIKGKVVGKIEANGDIRIRGRIVGKVEKNGDVRMSGRVVGKIESNGDVRKAGRVIGSAKGVKKEWAAVVFFFLDELLSMSKFYERPDPRREPGLGTIDMTAFIHRVIKSSATHAGTPPPTE